jgi:hypothetical protein
MTDSEKHGAREGQKLNGGDAHFYAPLISPFVFASRWHTR